MKRLVASPCSLPSWERETLFDAYAKLGFNKYEVFTGWVESRFEPGESPAEYLATAEKFGFSFPSLHLPPVSQDKPESIEEAVNVARSAKALGVEVVLYKADSRESYIACAGQVLDALEDIGVTPVVQNHFRTAVSSLEDMTAVMEGINDPRMKILLEVGHFALADVHWEGPCERFGDRIALVHVKDIGDGKPVPFGEGEVDFDGLFARLDGLGYRGDVVVEIEIDVDDTQRLKLMGEACTYLYQHGLKEL